MEIELKIVDKLKGVMDENNLDEIRREIENKEEIIKRLMEEFDKISADLEECFNAELDVCDILLDGKSYTVTISIVSSWIGDIKIECLDKDFSNETYFLIGQIKE